MVRQFKLINSKGETYDLMDRNHFLYSPDGLGFSASNTYVQIGNTFITAEEEISQPVVTGEMLFPNYSEYAKFYKFVSKKPLKLGYMPVDTWAYLDCVCTRMDKSEISYTDGFLHSAIDLTGLSMWYVPRAAMRSSTDTDIPKSYSYPYPYVYVESANGYFQITNNGTLECPIILSIFGYCKNPKWILSRNGKRLVENSITAEITSVQKLVVNAKDGSREIAIYTTDDTFVSDQYQYIDFDNKAFLVAPTGTTVLQVTEESGSTVNAVVEVDELYETI